MVRHRQERIRWVYISVQTGYTKYVCLSKNGKTHILCSFWWFWPLGLLQNLEEMEELLAELQKCVTVWLASLCTHLRMNSKVTFLISIENWREQNERGCEESDWQGIWMCPFVVIEHRMSSWEGRSIWATWKSSLPRFETTWTQQRPRWKSLKGLYWFSGEIE